MRADRPWAEGVGGAGTAPGAEPARGFKVAWPEANSSAMLCAAPPRSGFSVGDSTDGARMRSAPLASLGIFHAGSAASPRRVAILSGRWWRTTNCSGYNGLPSEHRGCSTMLAGTQRLHESVKMSPASVLPRRPKCCLQSGQTLEQPAPTRDGDQGAPRTGRPREEHSQGLRWSAYALSTSPSCQHSTSLAGVLSAPVV